MLHLFSTWFHGNIKKRRCTRCFKLFVSEDGSRKFLTLLRALHGVCKQVFPCHQQLSCPSVGCVRPSRHLQSLSCLFGCDLWCHTSRGLPLCLCSLCTHHFVLGVLPSLPFPLREIRLMYSCLLTDPLRQRGQSACVSADIG